MRNAAMEKRYSRTDTPLLPLKNGFRENAKINKRGTQADAKPIRRIP